MQISGEAITKRPFLFCYINCALDVEEVFGLNMTVNMAEELSFKFLM